MRTEPKDPDILPIKGAVQCPVTIIRNSRRILGVKITAGTAETPSSPGGPAPNNSIMRTRGFSGTSTKDSQRPLASPDHLVSRIWRHSPYCKDSPKYGLMVRENGRWVHKKSREG